MRKIVLLALLGSLLLSLASAAPPEPAKFETLKAAAEREYAEKSFRRAHELYEQAAKLELSPHQRRWVELRLADTTLRADIAAPDQDAAARTKARLALEELIRTWPDDAFRAEANEALGDHLTEHPWERNPGAAQPYYLAALDWWAGNSDLSLARRRYLDIVWKMIGRDDVRWDAPREVLVNAVAIAETPEDRARTRYLLARRLVMDNTEASVERAYELFEEILATGKKTPLYDDTLHHYASTLAQRGQYTKAVEIYRRILAEYAPGGTPHYDDAKRAIAEILESTVAVHVQGTFLPDSEQEIYLAWRNVKSIELSAFRVDLTRDVRFDQQRNWIETIATEGRPVERQWTHATNDSGEHLPGRDVLRLDPLLPVGAYLLKASAGGKDARTLLLVTDAHILVHGGGGETSVFVSDVVTGEPMAGARVHVWQRVDRDRVAEREARTDENGLARIRQDSVSGQILITASDGTRQAHHLSHGYWSASEVRPAWWRIYAFTDRPAYRPGETVQWKMFARVRGGEEWQTPGGERLEYEIVDPRGQKVIQGVAALNTFGSFWSELPLTSEMPLGAYTINFRAKDQHRGSAQLFRLEEYKLPEFLVKVSTPEGKQYRLGDTLEATIDATYYFGGPVANAEVELVVRQEPFYRTWYPRRHYSWYYDPPQQSYGGSIVKRETLRTDASGRAVVQIETPRDTQDLSYTIEARVVDASRREVRGAGTVRVTRQRYTVMAQPEHYVHRPGDSVSVDFKALDANDKPVSATGTVKVVRRRMSDPAPVPVPQRRGRTARSPQDADEEILTTKLTANAEGEATLTFTPKTIGYYVVRWTGTDGPRARDVVTAETAVWVTERATTELGFRPGGLDLIVDKDTLRAGETAYVMVAAPNSGRWVLFSTSGDARFDTQVLRMDGTVRLVQIPVTQKHVPNFFVTASSVFDRNAVSDVEQIVVPPVDQFLTVEVKTDREQYQPREEGTVTVTTRDVNGKPVAAEVALAVSDEAVTAIQSDPAGDPRQFFHGDRRGNAVQVGAGVQTQQYLKLEPRTAEEEEAKLEFDRQSRMEKSAVGGIVGGYAVAGAEGLAMAPPPPPAPAPSFQAMQEAVTVTAEAPMAKDQAANAIEVEVRTDFRSTAFWKPDLVTDASGTATVKVKYPEALTTWRATARAASAGAQFGMASSTARTSMPLLVRLQAPRFFVAGDRVVVSAVMNNNTDETLSVTPSLEAEGVVMQGGPGSPVTIAPHAEGRADWTVTAQSSGPAKLRVTARSSQYGDAMEKSFLVYEHGVDKLVARSGKMRGSEAIVRLELPRDRRATDLTVQVAPSLATAMLDALPYLVEFPYGCTEQTMSRFLPAAIVARTLEKLNAGRGRLSGKDLDAVTRAGMARLYDMQHGDGGWGWWKEGESDAFMTAYVVWGFAIARDGGLKIDSARVDRAAEWLDRNLVQREGAYNDQAWMLHALSAWRSTAGTNAKQQFDEVWENRQKLTAYSRALLALTAHRWNEAERARVLIRNLEDGVQIDATPDQSVLLPGETAAETMQTAHWGARGFWWRWYEGPVETTAFALQALVTIDPGHRLIEPVMNWLVKNRRGSRWNNTRDTAIALLAMNDYLQRSGELAGDVGYELSVNGQVIATKTLSAKDVLQAPSRFAVDGKVLKDTTQEIRIRRTSGKGPIYFSAEARFVSLEEPVKAAGNEIFVRREYFRLAPRPTLLKGVLYDRVALRDRDSIASGERVEVVVTVETKNDYSYLLFEDLKPAGFEAVEVQSGQSLYATDAKRSASRWVYQELRDRKVALFIDHLPQGMWEIRYTLRAEVPGSFHALPLLGQAMYVPDVRANGDEVRVTVTERE